MKRFALPLILVALFAGAGIYIGAQRASAYSCSFANGACGYFTDAFTNANNNVLPSPALWQVASATEFINRLTDDLNSGDSWSHTGAAFIIDNMLQYRGTVGQPVGGGQAAGIAYARNASNLNRWRQLVDYYASSSDPSQYGIDWAYWPSKATFCDSGTHIGSGFDVPRNDAAMYRIAGYPSAECNWEYSQSMPEIRFYWPGGSFEIGSLCGNLQDSLQPIPMNHNPAGTITVACDATIGQQIATVNFSDPDGGTTGYITINGWQSGNVASGAARRIAIPLPPLTSPTNAQTVTLHIKDVGPVAPPNHYVTVTASTDVPCGTVNCGSLTASPSPLDPYMRFSLTVRVTNNVGLPSGGRFQLTLTPPAGATYTFTGTQAAINSGNTASATFANLGPTTKTGLYHAAWTFTASGFSQDCSGSLPVVYLPYLSVYGGDVAVGGSPVYAAGSSSCAIDTQGGAFSWNNHAAGYAGGGAQYAVQALAQIRDVASGLDSSNAPTNLSFANTYAPADPSKLNPGQGLFGGYYGAATADCDFTSDLSSPPAVGNATLGTITVAVGSAVTHYINGNVYISGNIVYAGAGGWAKISDIPYFKLVVVGGDIYIDRSVTQLDGLYVAEPSGGVGGRIFTCASGLGNAVDLTAAGGYAACNKQLIINGAFVARSVAFGRTFGSVGQATAGDTVSVNHAAEVFNYTPELWLPRGASSPNSGYLSITGLPPVL